VLTRGFGRSCSAPTCLFCVFFGGNGDSGDGKKEKRRRSDSRDRSYDRRDRRRSRSPRRSRSRGRRRRKSHSPRQRKRSSTPPRRRDRRSRSRDRRDRDRDDRRDRDRRGDRDSRRRRDDDYEKRKKEKEEEEKKRREEEARKQKEEDERYKAEVAAQVEEIEEEEEQEKSAEQLAEERRKRRAAIMAKFSKKKVVEEKKPVNESKEGEEEKPLNASDLVEGKDDGEGYDMFIDPAEKIKMKGGASKLEGTVDADSFTNSEGYYVFRAGDMLHDRFRVISNQGRGVFSTVLRVQDTGFGNRELVVKIVRNNETMYKAGQKEVENLKLLASKDPEGKRHCVRLLSSFEHRNHLCMVFEPMAMNLRELLRKLGHVGLSIMAIQAFAKQLFLALKLCKTCSFIHGDIKPDNILVNKDLNNIKLCDFGSALFKKDAEITPYLCSRFYRAPEIMIGLLYDEQSDIWSVATVLYELYTGKVLYKGSTNNDMLRYHMEYNGNFPKRLIKRAKFKDQHFDENQVFLQRKVDPLSKLELKVPRKDLLTPVRNFQKVLKQHSSKLDENGKKKLAQLADLLTKMFNMDPSRRLRVEECLQHPFIKE